MKRIRILALTLAMPFIMGGMQTRTLAEDNPYAQSTNEPVLIKALDAMDGTTADWAKRAILGNNLTKQPIKIQFKDLSELNPGYKTFDALGWKNSGRLTIYINQKHRNAPPEALASILSHEAVHQDENSSIGEETYAWGYEANVWLQMKKRNPALAKLNPTQIPLVYRLNTLEKLFINADYSTKLIYNVVSSNPGYQSLPEHSPGF